MFPEQNFNWSGVARRVCPCEVVTSADQDCDHAYVLEKLLRPVV
jgi:hypothetical protein